MAKKRASRSRALVSSTALTRAVRQELDRVLSAGVQTRAAVPVAGQADPFFFRLRLNAMQEELTRPFEQHSTINACMRIVSENFVRAQLQFKRGEKGKSEREISDTDPCTVVWRKPNPRMFFAKFMQACITHIWDVGEVAIIKTATNGARLAVPGDVPAELWPIKGRLLSPILNKETQTPEAWRLQTSGGELILAPWEILWIQTFNPYHPWRGLGRLESALVGAQQDWMAQQFMTGFLANDATPGGVITYEHTMSREQREQVRESFESRHRGPRNSNRVLVLSRGMGFTPTTIAPKDMQYQELRKWNREDVRMVFGVPGILLQLTEDVNRATANAAKAVFIVNTLMPAGEYIASAITMDMQTTWVGCRDTFAEFDWNDCPEMKEIAAEQIAAAKDLFAMGVPLNEIITRLSLGLKPTKSGKTEFLPTTIVPANLLMNPPEPEPPPENGKPAGTPPEGEKPPNVAEEDDRPEEETEGQRARRALGIEKASALPRWHLYVAQVLTPVELSLAAKVRRFFWDLRRHMLDLVDEAFAAIQNPARAFVNRADGGEKTKRRLSRSLIDKLLFNEQEWGQRISEIIAPAHKDAAKKSLTFVKNELPKGVPTVMDIGDPKVSVFLAEQAIEVQGITSRVREQLRETLVTSVIEADTIAEAQAEVAEIMKHEAGNALARSLTIARTETASAANGVRQLELEEQAAQAGSRIKSHKWVTARDDHVRVAHMQIDGEVVPIGTPFRNGLLYPGEPSAPIEQRANCRCISVPVIEKK